MYIWPGGGITFMVDVTRIPDGAFGHVPTPALVAPVEFTLPLEAYRALGGHMADVVPLAKVLATRHEERDWRAGNPWPFEAPER